MSNLVSKDEVKIGQFQIDRLRRNSMLNIPDRVCAAIAAEVKELLINAGVPIEKAGAMDIVATIHSVKGGQADVVCLFPDLSQAGDAQYARGGRSARLGDPAVLRRRDTHARKALSVPARDWEAITI